MESLKNNRPPRGKRRPFEVYLLVLGALAFSGFGWLRLQQAVVYWAWIKPPSFPFSAWYVAAGGAAWGVAGLAAAVGLWFRLRRAAQFARLAAVFYALTYWLDRLLFTRSQSAWANWVFALSLTIAGLFFVFGALEMERQKRYLAYRPDPQGKKK